MIGNQRQLALSRRRLAELRHARISAESESNSVTLDRLINRLESDISEFERIEAGLLTHFHINSVDELGEAAVKARIASGLNQRELAEELGVTEQTVQRDESSLYERAGLAKIAEVLDALDHQLVGLVRPIAAQNGSDIVAYPPAIQGRVHAHRSDSSWASYIDRRDNDPHPPPYSRSSGSSFHGELRSSQNSIGMAVLR